MSAESKTSRTTKLAIESDRGEAVGGGERGAVNATICHKAMQIAARLSLFQRMAGDASELAANLAANFTL
ncbi:hypothetical protein PSP6_500011 [Paraburkholderia tropica]|nr:hypothetical protein PSP6_500011 [Paraburkholderia tropica]